MQRTRRCWCVAAAIQLVLPHCAFVPVRARCLLCLAQMCAAVVGWSVQGGCMRSLEMQYSSWETSPGSFGHMQGRAGQQAGMKWVSICVLGWGQAAHPGNNSRCFSRTQDLAEAFCRASSFVWQCAQRVQALGSKAVVAVRCVGLCADCCFCRRRQRLNEFFLLQTVCSLQHLCVVAGNRQVMAGADEAH